MEFHLLPKLFWQIRHQQAITDIPMNIMDHLASHQRPPSACCNSSANKTENYMGRSKILLKYVLDPLRIAQITSSRGWPNGTTKSTQKNPDSASYSSCYSWETQSAALIASRKDLKDGRERNPPFPRPSSISGKGWGGYNTDSVLFIPWVPYNLPQLTKGRLSECLEGYTKEITTKYMSICS